MVRCSQELAHAQKAISADAGKTTFQHFSYPMVVSHTDSHDEDCGANEVDDGKGKLRMLRPQRDDPGKVHGTLVHGLPRGKGQGLGGAAGRSRLQKGSMKGLEMPQQPCRTTKARSRGRLMS